jgi:hypothetical protein
MHLRVFKKPVYVCDRLRVNSSWIYPLLFFYETEFAYRFAGNNSGYACSLVGKRVVLLYFLSRGTSPAARQSPCLSQGGYLGGFDGVKKVC